MCPFWRRPARAFKGIRASWEREPAKREHDLVEFLNWFDAAASVEDAIRRAEVDWRTRFASEPEYATIPKGTALEIGFGAGRLLAQAARDFTHVIGVDVHVSFEMSRRFLASQGISDATLLHRDELARVPDRCVDLVYSFIVFQHFDGMAEVDHYLAHIRRVLRPQGYAHLYLGRNPGKGIVVVPEDKFEPRARSLLIEPSVMRDRLARDFDVFRARDRLPKDAFSGTGESGQFAVLFRTR